MYKMYKMYKVSKSLEKLPMIVEVDVVKTSYRYVWLIWKNGDEIEKVRKVKHAQDYSYFNTYDEAKEYLITLYDNRIKVKHDELSHIKEKKKEVMKMLERQELNTH